MLDASEFKQLLAKADADFVQACVDRMELGEQQYGPFKFMEADTLQEAMDEVIDLVNYGRMTYIKLSLLQANLQKMLAGKPEVDDKGFVSMKEFHQGK
jgi:hypothetical protein